MTIFYLQDSFLAIDHHRKKISYETSFSGVALFNHLGYPAYLLPFIGIAKLLGVVAILVPGFRRMKAR
jgi:DoxX-like family